MSSLELFAIFFPVFFITYLIVRDVSRKRSSAQHRCPPSLPSLPLIGSLPFLRNVNDISAFFTKKSNQLGPLYTLRVGNKLILILNNKEVIGEAFVKNGGFFSFRPEIFADTVVNPRKKGIVYVGTTLSWKKDHQMALAIMKEFGFGAKSLMEERILSEIQSMVTFVGRKQGSPFEADKISVLIASNIITSIVFGRRREYGLGFSDLVVEIVRWANHIDVALDVAPFLQYIPMYKKRLATLAETGRMIHAIIEAEMSKSLKEAVRCFVCRYVEKQGPAYDNAQLNYLIRDLVGGGTETTSTTFLWMLVALANNPDVQKRLHDEIDSVIPRDRFKTIQDQTKLPYHEATILELYRWRTLSSLAVPHLTTGDTILRGYFIPRGTVVMPNLHAAHNNQADWKEPEIFRPDRFLDKDNNVTGRDRVIPFGLGRRSCFGEILARAQVFLIFASIVQRFNVLPPEGIKKIDDRPKLPVTITTMPRPFLIRLRERE